MKKSLIIFMTLLICLTAETNKIFYPEHRPVTAVPMGQFVGFNFEDGKLLLDIYRIYPILLQQIQAYKTSTLNLWTQVRALDRTIATLKAEKDITDKKDKILRRRKVRRIILAVSLGFVGGCITGAVLLNELK